VHVTGLSARAAALWSEQCLTVLFVLISVRYRNVTLRYW